MWKFKEKKIKSSWPDCDKEDVEERDKYVQFFSVYTLVFFIKYFIIYNITQLLQWSTDDWVHNCHYVHDVHFKYNELVFLT